MRLIFETVHLNHATPATVSRAGRYQYILHFNYLLLILVYFSSKVYCT